MGRKKADDETEGTWLRLAALAGRPVELPPVLPVKLALFADRPGRNEVGCAQAPGSLWEEMCDLPVPVWWLCLCESWVVSYSRPSSVPMSVIREDIILGGPVARPGYWGKASSSPAGAAAGVLDLELSWEAMAHGPSRFQPDGDQVLRLGRLLFVGASKYRGRMSLQNVMFSRS